RQKPRFLPAAYEVMSAEIVSTISAHERGAIAQLGERLVCNQKVAGSIPAGSTSFAAAPQPTREARSARAHVISVSSRERAMRLPHRVLFNNPESFLF